MGTCAITHNCIYFEIWRPSSSSMMIRLWTDPQKMKLIRHSLSDVIKTIKENIDQKILSWASSSEKSIKCAKTGREEEKWNICNKTFQSAFKWRHSICWTSKRIFVTSLLLILCDMSNVNCTSILRFCRFPLNTFSHCVFVWWSTAHT